MPVVDIAIGQRTFQLVCGEGQEKHLQNLAANVSEKIDMLAQSMENYNDTLLLVMASLMLQDEVNELRAAGHTGSSKLAVNTEEEIDLAVTEAVTAISEYIEGVADRIETMQ